MDEKNGLGIKNIIGAGNEIKGTDNELPGPRGPTGLTGPGPELPKLDIEMIGGMIAIRPIGMSKEQEIEWRRRMGEASIIVDDMRKRNESWLEKTTEWCIRRLFH